MNTHHIKQTAENGFLYEENGITVVSLYGSWKQMGRQYGTLCNSYLKDVYQFVRVRFSKDEKKALEGLRVAERLYAHYPHRFKTFFAGMEETSGLNLDELKLINAVEYMEGFYCSGMAVWGNYAKGPLIYGRNYDGASFAPLYKDVLLTVFHPVDGSLSCATIGYAGEFYCVNGFNEKGLFVELNNAMPSAGYDIHFNRFASTTTLMELLLDADSIAYAEAFFQTEKSFSSFLIGVADSLEARCYEWCTDGIQKGSLDTPNGLMVMTNHYVHREWPYAVPTDSESWYSHTRRNNMLHLAEIHKGKIDVETMCDIMETPMEAGGPQHTLTLYQIVYEPASMKLHLRIVGGPSWTEIFLQDFFNAKPQPE